MELTDRPARLRAIASTIERPYAAYADELRHIARTLEENTDDRDRPDPDH